MALVEACHCGKALRVQRSALSLSGCLMFMVEDVSPGLVILSTMPTALL